MSTGSDHYVVDPGSDGLMRRGLDNPLVNVTNSAIATTSGDC